jgi:hypothetical protein
MICAQEAHMADESAVREINRRQRRARMHGDEKMSQKCLKLQHILLKSFV